ncbi:hypothetical protein [Endozoicomonas montiporae]|nr:hypothetical protein [Endozoicomonas montiporae]
MENTPSYKKWQSNLQTPTKGMPEVLATAKYESNGENDKTESLHSSDMPFKIHFVEAVYSSAMTYTCYYEADRHDLKGLSVSLRLSEAYIPGSIYLPLLLETSGKHWITNKQDHWTEYMEATYKVCSKSAKDCAFHLPRVAARSNVETPKPSNQAASFRIHLSLAPDPTRFGKGLYLKQLNSTEYQFLEPFEGKAINGTGITLVDSDFFVDINEYTKAREGNQDNQECDVHSKSAAKCSCSSENLKAAVNANGHVVLDLFAAYKEDSFTVAKADCNLFFIPELTEEHEPHDHSIEQNKEEL